MKEFGRPRGTDGSGSRKDLVAGLVLTTLLVPQGMAYAELAGLPPITGLYTSILCLLGYAVFGPSRILVLGPDSSLGPMIAATILPLVAADGDPHGRSRWPRCSRSWSASSCVLAGVAKLGFIADLLSKPTHDRLPERPGADHPRRASCPSCSGSRSTPTASSAMLKGFVEGVADGETVPPRLAVGLAAASSLILACCSAGCPKIPGVLVMVRARDRRAVAFDLAEHGVSTWSARSRRGSRR